MDHLLKSILKEAPPRPNPPPAKKQDAILDKFDKFFAEEVSKQRALQQAKKEDQLRQENEKQASYERYLRMVVNVPLSYEIFESDYDRIGLKPNALQPKPNNPHRFGMREF
jgi:hypothetical protein